ncbi:hypothetical protein CBR_g18902 [Chara braunii]|uniref:Reverse transcriptase domain-containing protein n=1 Tax=Chara braunii TaxID=69332 RepID=A0A388KWY6_CHABU|nr:hypothetical protein CBR_g18902 [Chara braunii]|eukprot:GBG74492.1 hypothetical protein CBR_g18902 [Chara braunii]
MATSSAMSQAASQASSSGVSQGMSQPFTCQFAGLQVSQQQPLSAEDYEIQQTDALHEELQRHLKEVEDRRENARRRKARLEAQGLELSRLEDMDGEALTLMYGCFGQVQAMQQEMLATLIAGQNKILAALQVPRPMARPAVCVSTRFSADWRGGQLRYAVIRPGARRETGKEAYEGIRKEDGPERTRTLDAVERKQWRTTTTFAMSTSGGDDVPARSPPCVSSPQGTPFGRLSVDRSPSAALGLLGGSPLSSGSDVRTGKRRRGDVSPATSGIVAHGLTHRASFPGLLGASPPAVSAVRNVVAYAGVLGAPLLPSPLLPRRLDYASTIPPAPVWSHAVPPSCPRGRSSVDGGRSDVHLEPVAGTPSSAANNIVQVCVRDGCRRRLYALRDAMASVSDNHGPVSDVVDRLLHWSLPAIRAEFGVGVAATISSTLSSCVCGKDFQLRYLLGDSGGDYVQGGSQGSGSATLGGSQDGSQNSFPSSRRVSQRSDRGRGRPRSAGRSQSTHVRPQTWSDSWEGVDQCGPGPDRDGVEEAMTQWTGPEAPNVVFLEPQQLYHATVTVGLTYTLLDNFCVALGLCSVHKPTFYNFMRGPGDDAEGWNGKVVRQGLRYSELAIETVIRRGEPVTLMVDGRYDSARGAQHCTVTAMEYETRLVVGVMTRRPKTEGKASSALEVPAVVRLLRGLLEKGLKIWCVVFDDCAALGPQLRALNIDWQKDCHHKIKNIRKLFRSMPQLKEAKKVSNPHECVSDAQFMQFTKKQLVEALHDRFEPGVLTTAEERMKKSDFIGVVMKKTYPFGSRTNVQELTADPDGVTEYHAHEVGMWFLHACQLCKEEGGDTRSLHRDIMLIVDHWACDHSGCVDGKDVLCEKADGPGRLPLYRRTNRVYGLVQHVMGKQCSTNITTYYIEFRHTSAVETFQGTIIIYAKKSVHFEKSYSPRVAIAMIRWNSHCWCAPVGYRARIPAGTSIRPRPAFHRQTEDADDSWMHRLAAFMFGSSPVSDWARKLLRQEDCPYGAGPASSPLPLPRDLFVAGGADPVDVADDASSGSDHDVAGDSRIFIVSVPAPLMDAGVEVVDLHAYIAKIDREFKTQRYDDIDAPLLYVCIQIGEATCNALIDCGASCNYINQDFMVRAGLGPRVRRKSQPTQVNLADGHTHKSIDRCIDAVPVYFAPHASEGVSFDILDTKFDMILGMSWLRSEDHPVNFFHRTVHIRDRNGVLVPCTVPLPHPSINCHVVSAASMRASVIRDDIEEMGVCFLHASSTDSSSDPRITELLDAYSDVFEGPHGVVPDRPICHEIILEDGARLDDFIKLVEETWHDPQEAQKAIDGILALSSRKLRWRVFDRSASDASLPLLVAGELLVVPASLYFSAKTFKFVALGIIQFRLRVNVLQLHIDELKGIAQRRSNPCFHIFARFIPLVRTGIDSTPFVEKFHDTASTTFSTTVLLSSNFLLGFFNRLVGFDAFKDLHMTFNCIHPISFYGFLYCLNVCSRIGRTRQEQGGSGGQEGREEATQEASSKPVYQGPLGRGGGSAQPAAPSARGAGSQAPGGTFVNVYQNPVYLAPPQAMQPNGFLAQLLQEMALAQPNIQHPLGQPSGLFSQMAHPGYVGGFQPYQAQNALRPTCLFPGGEQLDQGRIQVPQPIRLQLLVQQHQAQDLPMPRSRQEGCSTSNQLVKLSCAGGEATPPLTPPDSAALLAASYTSGENVDVSPRFTYEDYVVHLVPPLDQPLHMQDSTACTVSTPSATDSAASPPTLAGDSTSWSRLEKLDPLSFADFQRMPLPPTGRLPKPHCNVLMAQLRDYLHTAIPAPLMDAGVEVVNLRDYIAKIDREFKTQRYNTNDAPLMYPTQVTVADGHTHKSIDRCIDSVPVYFAPHASKVVSFDILDTKFDMILGMSWLESEDQPVNFYRHTVHIRDRNGVLVSCTVPPPQCSISCHMVSAASIRAAITRDDVEEMGVCFLHALPPHDIPSTDASTDPRITKLLDAYAGVFEPHTKSYRIGQSATRSSSRPGPYLCIIRPSSSPYGAPVLVVRKKNKDLRLCIDYRKLNAQTVKNAGPLLRINDLLERLCGTKFFSKLDLKLGYHQLEIRQDRCKTAFKMRYGHFEWYSRIVAPLTRLQPRKVLFAFDDEACRSFQALKTVMLMAPVLSIYDPTLPTRVTTGASGYGIGAVLEQHDGDDWHPVEYFSHKVPPINSLDDARKKELLAFVMALKQSRHFLFGCRRFTWVTDNNPLTYYKTQDTVSSTIGRWMYFIDQFDFTLKHLASLSNRAVDALSRRPDLCAMTHHAFAFDEELQRHFIRVYQSDPDFATLYVQLSSDHPLASNYRIVDGYLLLHSRGKNLLCALRTAIETVETGTDVLAVQGILIKCHKALDDFVVDPVEPESQVAFSTSCLGGEAKEWVLAEANAAGFDDIGVWAETLDLKQFLAKIKERFLDKTTTDKAFDQLTTIGQKHWTSVEALSREVDRLLQVPGLNLQDNQVLYIYSRALPEPIRGELVAESKSAKYNYRQFRDLALQREQMTSQVKNSYASVVKYGGGPGTGKRVLWRQKRQDHTLVVFDDETVERWSLEAEGVANSSDSGKGEVTAAVVNKGGPRPPVKKRKARSFPKHPGIAVGKPWEKRGLSKETWQERMDNAQCLKCGIAGHVFFRLYDAFERQRTRAEEDKARLKKHERERIEREKVGVSKRSLEMTKDRTAKEYSNYGELLYVEGVVRAEQKKKEVEKRLAEEKEAQVKELTLKPEIRPRQSTAVPRQSTKVPRRQQGVPPQQAPGLTRCETTVMDQKSWETDEAYQARMLLMITEAKQQSDALAAAAKKKAEDVEKAHLFAIEQQRQQDEAAAKAVDEERIQQLEQRICAAAANPSSAPRETTPRFDDQEIFCDSTKTDPIPWFHKFELKLQLLHISEDKHHAYLYSRSGGTCQAWSDNLLSKYGVVAVDLHTKISWDDLKAEWHKRFQVEPPEIKAMDKLITFEQGTLSSVDWIAEYQRLTSVPDIQMGFKAVKHYFISRPCPVLGNALTHVEETLTTTAELFDKAAQIIVMNKEAKNLHCSSAVACEFRKQRYDDNNAPLLYVRIQVGQASCSALLDSGAFRNFMSQAFMQTAGLGAQVRRKANPMAIKLVDGRTQQLIDRYIGAVPVYFAPHACKLVTFDILDTDFNIILGMLCLASADHTVHFHRRTLTVCDAFGAEVPCTIPLPHPSIRCQVVTAKSFRATCTYEQPDEIGLCFLRTVAVADSSPTDFSSDPRVVRLLNEFADIFESPTDVVPDRSEIILEAGAVPLKGCIYRMCEEELIALRAQLDDLLDKGWIRPSSSPYGAPVLFVRKKNKDLRLCIDYRKLNAQTVKNVGPLPRIDDLLERLGGVKYFSKLDLKSGYHQISIRLNDRYKSAFKTRYGHFEWVVMPFGLTNAPTTFQATMTNEFRAMLDRFVLVYLDDILVYSRTLEDHLGHLRRVLETLRHAKYKANRDKCEFVRQELEYLGHFATPEGINPLSNKIEAIQAWPEPQNVTDIHSFLGLAGYYQCFIKGYSKISAHLTKIQCEDRSFDFGEDARESFLALKAALYLRRSCTYTTRYCQRTSLRMRPAMALVSSSNNTMAWTGTRSKKVPVVHSIDDARKKELLAFVHALKWWRHFLLGRSQFRW